MTVTGIERRVVHPDEADYWQKTATDWRQGTRDWLWRRHSDAVNAALLARWLPACNLGRVLKTDLFDETCSEGLVPLLQSRGARVVGIDVAPATAEAARARYADIEVVPADVRSLPFADDSFDHIVSNSTLDHFQTQAELVVSIGELVRVLRPGGQLILTLDNLSNPAVGVRNAIPFHLLNRIGIVPYFVGATCNERTLLTHARAAGLDVQESGYILHAPRVVAVMASRLVARLGPRFRRLFLRGLTSLEVLDHLPTRKVTGYFVTLRATKARGATGR